MNLDELIPNDTTIITLKHPVTGADLPLQIEIYGTHSATYKAVTAQNNDERLEMARNGKHVTSAVTRKQGFRTLTACTKRLIGEFEARGQKFPSTAKGISDLYQTVDWIYDQINVDMAKISNFLPVPPKA